MKFRCERDPLVEALNAAGRAVTSRGSSLPVLSGLRLEVKGDQLSVTGSDERLWFNQPSVFVHDRFLAKPHHKEEAVLLGVGSLEMREVMLEAEPKLFYITDHYRSFPFVLARLSALDAKVLKQMLTGRAAQLAAMKPIKRAAKKAGAKKKAAKKKAVRKKPSAR